MIALIDNNTFCKLQETVTAASLAVRGLGAVQCAAAFCSCRVTNHWQYWLQWQCQPQYRQYYNVNIIYLKSQYGITSMYRNRSMLSAKRGTKFTWHEQI